MYLWERSRRALHSLTPRSWRCGPAVHVHRRRRRVACEDGLDSCAVQVVPRGGLCDELKLGERGGERRRRAEARVGEEEEVELLLWVLPSDLGHRVEGRQHDLVELLGEVGVPAVRNDERSLGRGVVLNVRWPELRLDLECAPALRMKSDRCAVGLCHMGLVAQAVSKLHAAIDLHRRRARLRRVELGRSCSAPPRSSCRAAQSPVTRTLSTRTPAHFV